MLFDRSKRYTLMPWKVAVAGSILSIAFAIPFAVLTDVHHMPIPGGYQIPTIYLVIFIPIVSIIWAFIGIWKRKRDRNLIWCFFSIFFSITAIGFAVVSTLSN